MMWLYAAYNRHFRLKDTSKNTVTRRELEWLYVLVSDKIAIKKKGVEREKKTFYNDKKFNPSRRYNNYKYIFT